MIGIIDSRARALQNPLLHWRFDEPSGNALDSSGNGFAGTVSGATQNVAGHLNTAYSFVLNDNVINTDAGLTTALTSISSLTNCFYLPRDRTFHNCSTFPPGFPDDTVTFIDNPEDGRVFVAPFGFALNSSLLILDNRGEPVFWRLVAGARPITADAR